MTRVFLAVGLALAMLLGPAQAFGLMFSGSSGSLAASADFSVVGGDLQLTLTNTSSADVLVPADILTAVFFDLPGNPTLTSLSADLAAGSTVLFGVSGPGGVVGGEWAYGAGLSGAPGGATQGISSSGFGLFGGATFPGTNLQGPAAVNGMQYGIVSAGDNPLTGNKPVTGTNALIQNSVVFTLGDLPIDFSVDGITNVLFQYGTALTEPTFPGHREVVPEPASLSLLGLGLAGMAVRHLRVRPR